MAELLTGTRARTVYDDQMYGGQPMPPQEIPTGPAHAIDETDRSLCGQDGPWLFPGSLPWPGRPTLDVTLCPECQWQASLHRETRNEG